MGSRNLISLLIIFLVSGCSSFSIKTDFKQNALPSQALIFNGERYVTEPEFIDLSSSTDLHTKEAFSIPEEEIEQSALFSFELALKDYLKYYRPQEEVFLPLNYVLFSFADQLFSTDEGYLSQIPEAGPKKERAKLRAKKEAKGMAQEDIVEKDEIKPIYTSLSNFFEASLNALNIPPQQSNAEFFSWENRAEDFLPANPNLNSEAKSSPASSANDQISSIVSLFPSVLNEKVKDFINYFQNKAESFFSKALARSQAYEEMMKKIFREKNLPEELFYLALIESGFNPFAVSRAQASGIWQFVSKTAKRFGLRVDKWVDERRDPEKSTYAAAEYLKQLYEMFNCWELAAASFNAGEGKILKAMKKTQSQNFWDIAQHRYLKAETKKYVPMFLAAMLIAKEPEKYGFSNIPYHPPLTYEKIIVPPSTSLAWVAKVSETDLAELRALNPALKMDKTPPHEEFEIKLPAGKKEVFERNIAAQKRFAATMINKHRVRPGETLGSIARKYKVNLRQLCELNGLSPKDKIKPGLVLLLPP